MGLLEDRTTTEVVTEGQISGYVFAGETRDGVQRLEWVLFDRFRMVPRAAMTLRPVTDDAWRHDTLAGFAAQAERRAPASKWSYCHARARSRAYEHPVEMVIDPDHAPEDFQIEAGRGMQLISGPAAGVLGICYARKDPDRDGVFVEHWKLASDRLAVTDEVEVAALAEARPVTFTRSVEVDNVYDDAPPVA